MIGGFKMLNKQSFYRKTILIKWRHEIGKTVESTFGTGTIEGVGFNDNNEFQIEIRRSGDTRNIIIKDTDIFNIL